MLLPDSLTFKLSLDSEREKEQEEQSSILSL